MLTLKERERIAYITNSPDHALLVELMGMQEELLEVELRCNDYWEDAPMEGYYD